MAQKDIYSDIAYQLGIVATLSGTTPGTALSVDLLGFQACTFAVFTGTVTDAGTAAGITWELQESDDNSAFTAVADADLIGLESDLAITDDADDNKFIGKLGYIGASRYLRLIPTGTTGTDATVVATASLGFPANAPV